MEKILTQCPECQTKYRLNQTRVGKNIQCPNCDEVFVVQDISGESAPHIHPPQSAEGESVTTKTYGSAPTKTYSGVSDNRTQTYAPDPSLVIQSDLTPNATQTYEQSKPSPTPTTHNLNIGDSLILTNVSYTITDIISQGTGEAVIYKIVDDQHAPLALKLYFEFPDPRQEPNSEALQRIQQITDPDILRLYDFGTGSRKYHNAYCFEICQFAEGGNLLVRNDYPPQFIRKTIIPQIFKGIQRLHRHKIYHCDLKPENIFWLDAAQTDLVIGDYGSAKTFEESSSKQLSHTSTSKGTDFYLAPEQPRGIISEKNDYYSFGIILLHLLYPQYVNRASLHKILERQYGRKPIIDYDPKYQDFNDAIAGLTLVDIAARWGEQQVAQWLRGERIPILYTTDADVHPIKLGKATIRTKEQLLQYIEQNTDWHRDVIEDAEGYSHLLRWLSDVQDIRRKKVFDTMVRHYRQDGARFLTLAVQHYFAPELPIQLDMQAYGFWQSQNLGASVQQYFQHVDNLSEITAIGNLKFHIFQLEFVLRQIAAMTDGQAKMVAISIINKLESVLGLSPKDQFNDYVCHCYPKVTEKVFPLLLYAFDQPKAVTTRIKKQQQDIADLHASLDNAIKSLDNLSDESQKNGRKINRLQRGIKDVRRSVGRMHGFAMFLLFLAWPLSGISCLWLDQGRGMLDDNLGLGALLGPLSAFGMNDYRQAGVAIGLSLIPMILMLLLTRIRRTAIEHGNQRRQQKISALQTRQTQNRNAQHQQQREYETLVQQQSTSTDKVSQLEHDIKRVSAFASKSTQKDPAIAQALSALRKQAVSEQKAQRRRMEKSAPKTPKQKSTPRPKRRKRIKKWVLAAVFALCVWFFGFFRPELITQNTTIVTTSQNIVRSAHTVPWLSTGIYYLAETLARFDYTEQAAAFFLNESMVVGTGIVTTQETPLNIRRGRGHSYTTLGQAQKGERLIVLQNDRNGWTLVRLKSGVVGYGSSQYIRIE